MTKLRKAWGRLRRESGYSLIELLVTVAILGVVLGGLTTIFVSGSRAELNMNRRFQAQQSARLALSRVRTDIHAACTATVTPTTVVVSGTSYSVTDLALTNLDTTQTTPTCTVAAVAWCFAASTQYPGRLALYRVASTSSCSSPTAGTRIGDAIVAGSSYFAYTAGGSGLHASLAVTLPANAAPPGNTSTPDYTLTDQIVLRNSPRT